MRQQPGLLLQPSENNNDTISLIVIPPGPNFDLDWEPNDDRIIESPGKQIQVVQNEDATPSAYCFLVFLPGYIIVILAPFATALMEAAYMAISVNESNNPSIYMIALTSGVTFLSSFQYNNGFRSSNTDMLCRIIRQRETPGWAELSSSKETIAFCMALLPTGWSILSEYSQSFWSINEIFIDYRLERFISPLAWKVGNVFISVCAGFNSLLSTGFETWRRCRAYFSGQPLMSITEAENSDGTPNHPPCYFIRIPMAILNSLNAIQDGIYVYVALEANMGVENLWERILLGSFSSLTVIGNLCTEGPFVINFLEDSFYSKSKFQPSRLITSAITLGTATTLAYYTRFLVEQFYKKVAHDYEFDDLPHLAEIAFYLSCILTLQHIISSTASLYDLTFRLFKAISSPVNKMLHWFQEQRKPKHPSHTIEEQPLTQDEEDDYFEDDTFVDRSFIIKKKNHLSWDDQSTDEAIELDVLKNKEALPESIHLHARYSSNPHHLFAQKPLQLQASPLEEDNLDGIPYKPADKLHRPCVLF